MAHTTTVACQPGHPRGRRGRIVAKRWQGDVVARIVHDALALRRLDDPESVTEATRALVAGVKTLLDRPLTGYETTRFRRLAASAKPSVVIRFVHRLNGRITDRVARVLATRSDISELIWA